MESPVDHVGSGEHNNRFDATIGVIAFFAIGNELLVVVSTVNIQASVVFECCRVGAEHTATDGVARTRTFILLCKSLRIQLQTEGRQYGQ